VKHVVLYGTEKRVQSAGEAKSKPATSTEQ
jgi:hypothetical protein